MADRLGRVLADQRAFAADASHQLRSPLTALRLEIEQLAELDEGDRDDAVARAVREIERLTGIVTSLLTLARHDGGDEVELLDVDATAVARDRIAAWRPVAAHRGVRLIAPTTTEDVTARCGDGFLEQVLDVLIANAVTVSPEDGSITVTVEDAPDGRVRVHVDDEGPGLEPAVLERAF